ncbi:MAG: hypothetical protein JWO86_4527 [Myxococcaceae bacterium]|nr:hypothetical protein [Myxococcaceae bacterium]
MSRRFFVAAASAVLAVSACERVADADEPAPVLVPSYDLGPRGRLYGQPVWRVGPAFTLAAGGTSLRLLDLPFTGGHALAGISAEVSSRFSLGTDVEYVRASSPHGLSMQLGRLDVTPTLVLDRVRLGAGMDVAWLSISRATGGSPIGHLGFGVHARASVDLVRIGERGGLFVSCKPSYDGFGSPGLYGGDIALGARF